MIRRASFLAVLMLTACSPQAPQDDARAKVDTDKYSRDRELCRSTVAEYTKERRIVDDSRREVFSGNYDRYGQGDLPAAMDAYGDNRNSDRLVERCMEQHGYPAASKPWWQKIGS
jgi:hypothetical protein